MSSKLEKETNTASKPGKKFLGRNANISGILVGAEY